jgi:hypothetical protein
MVKALTLRQREHSYDNVPGWGPAITIADMFGDIYHSYPIKEPMKKFELTDETREVLEEIRNFVQELRLMYPSVTIGCQLSFVDQPFKRASRTKVVVSVVLRSSRLEPIHVKLAFIPITGNVYPIEDGLCDIKDRVELRASLENMTQSILGALLETAVVLEPRDVPSPDHA